MPSIAVPTVFLVSFALNGLATVYLVLAWRQGTAYAGPRQWAAAAATSTVAAVLVATRGAIPEWLSTFGASALIVLAYAQVLLGLRLFVGREGALGRTALGFFFAAALAFLTFLTVWPHVGARVVIFSTCTVYLAVHAAWLCLRGLHAHYRAQAGFIGAIFVLLALGHAVRGAVALDTVRAGLDPRLAERPPTETFIMLLTIVGWSVVLFALPSLQQRRLFLELEESAARVRRLEGILPICMFCKRIRDGASDWKQVETYVEAHSEAAFTHSICPTCEAEHYPETG